MGSHWIKLPRNATPEMREAAEDVERFRALGNRHGQKQAEAHLKRLIRNSRQKVRGERHG